MNELGKEPETYACGRDAVHVAVIPAIVGDEFMLPGKKVRITSMSGELPVVQCLPEGEDDYDGVVDCFRTDPLLSRGHRILLMLRPGTTTNLRHEWDHPKLPRQPIRPVDVDDDDCSFC